MKRLFVFMAIFLFVIMIAGCATIGTTCLLERQYMSYYGPPSYQIHTYSKELGWEYKIYTWEDRQIQVILGRDKEQQDNKWFLVGVYGKCLRCGKYHIPIPQA